LNRDLSADPARPFLDADQAKAFVSREKLRIKSLPGIAHVHTDQARTTRDFNLGLPHSAVFHDVVQGFLRDPVQAKGYSSRQPTWDLIPLAFNRHIMTLSDFSTEASHGGHQSEMVQL
jgi:hypothetical protein